MYANTSSFGVRQVICTAKPLVTLNTKPTLIKRDTRALNILDEQITSKPFKVMLSLNYPANIHNMQLKL